MKVDIVILGAGPAASAVAILAQRAGMAVALIAPSEKVERSFIPETLPPSAGPLLQSLCVWEKFQQKSFPRTFSIASAWGSRGVSERNSICNPLGPGWYIDRSVFDDLLLQRAVGSNGVRLLRDKVVCAKYLNSHWMLHLNKIPCPIEASVVVDASGSSSVFARRIGVGRHHIDRQICLSRCYRIHAGREALLESAPEGWWFSAPVSQNELGVAFFTDADLIRPDFRSPSAWTALLQNTIYTNARVREAGMSNLHVCMASASYSQKFSGEGWLAVGDAALAYDPLASQGLLQALRSAQDAFRSMSAHMNGKPHEAISYYNNFQQGALERFLLERHYYYSAEKRWPKSAFWQRRSGTLRQAGES